MSPERRRVLSWAFYDWANSAFATTVMAGFFPVFFKQYWSAGVDAGTSTFRLGVANSVASAVIVVLAPLIGAIADVGRRRKQFLVVFAGLGVLSTAALFFVAKGQWAWACVLFVTGSIGFMGGNVFYDSLIIGVAPEAQRDRVSALGYSLGYLGGGLLFAGNVATTIWPHAFGLADRGQAVRVAFLSVAIWWAVFSLPMMRWVEEPRAAALVPDASPNHPVRDGLRQLVGTFREIRKLRIVFGFLIAYWLYIDGVDTIMRMAVDYGLSIGLNTQDLIAALLITQFVGFPAAIVFGRLGERMGAKRAVLLGIGVYAAVTAWASQMDSSVEFYGLAAVVGLVQGGVQALSRSLYTRIIPADRATEFFGFYNMLGKFAAIIGPVLVGGVSLVTGSARGSILAVLVLFVSGGLLLWRVDVAEGERIARSLESGGSPP